MFPTVFPHAEHTFTFPKLRQINLESGRVYKVESGDQAGVVLPSITRILAYREKPELTAWKKRVGKEEAARVSARATIQGSNLHSLAEAYLKNEPLPNYSPNVAELWQHLRTWLNNNISCVYGQEIDVCSFKLGGAGRFDLLAAVQDVLAVVDLKSSKKPKKAEWIEDYYLQGTFYACAIFELTGKPIKKIVFPIVSPEGVQEFETSPGAHFGALRERIAEFYAQYDSNLDSQKTA